MRSLSIGVRLVAVLLGFGLTASAIEGVSFARTSADLSALQARSSALLRLNDLTHRLAESIVDQHNGVRDYILTGSADALKGYQDGRTLEGETFGEMAAIADAFPAVAGEIEAVRVATYAWRLRYLDATVALVGAGQRDEARSSVRLAGGAARFHDVTVANDALEEHVARLSRSNLSDVDRIMRDRASMFVIGLVVALAGALTAVWLLSRWVVRPLARLLATARRVESGDDVPFPSDSDDEIGRLGGALERMREGLFSQATEASVVNRFTELTAFVEADGDVARATLDALEELVDPADGAIHISNRS